jgi:uncharacterized protein involved in cysteine biosynthesis
MLYKCFINKSFISSIFLLILAELIELYVYNTPRKQAKIIEFISIIVVFKVNRIAFPLKTICWYIFVRFVGHVTKLVPIRLDNRREAQQHHYGVVDLPS